VEVHQLTQGFSRGDATSNMALKIREVLHGLGHTSSRIFSLQQHIGPEEGERCSGHEEHAQYSGPDSVLLYHYGNASPLSDYFASVPDRKVLVFHNVTPPEYFRALFPDTAQKLEHARDDLQRLSACTDLCCGISRFNLSGLDHLSFRETMLFPAWIDEAQLAIPPAQNVMRQYADNYINLVFVGRVAPNKKIEDLLVTFHCLKTDGGQRNIRLFVVGSYVGTELYQAYLLSLCRRLGLADVVFTGHVSQAELNAYYTLADAFVCASEHEGFCIPIIEAAHFGVPVFAYDIPGVRETLGGCGVLFNRRDFRRGAATIRRVLEDPGLKHAIVEKQGKRLADFDESHVKERVAEILRRVERD